MIVNIAINSTNHAYTIEHTAWCLIDNFLKPLYEQCIEKTYRAYVGCMEKIIAWAHEFYIEYCDQLSDWNLFKNSNRNIFNAGSSHDFLLAWAQQKIDQCLIGEAG